MNTITAHFAVEWRRRNSLAWQCYGYAVTIEQARNAAEWLRWMHPEEEVRVTWVR